MINLKKHADTLSNALGISIEIAEKLVEKNIYTVYQISLYHEEEFVTEFSKILGSNAQAQSAFKRAKYFTQLGLQHYMQLKGLTPHYRKSKADNISMLADKQFEDQPSYQEIFGITNYCDVNPSRSLLSPDAYLIDLFKFTRDHVKSTNAKYAFDYRRQDILDIPVDYDHTFDTIPKLEIVNAAIQYHLEQNLMGTDGKALYENDDTLSDPINIYPMRLPANLGMLETDQLLKLFNTDLAQTFLAAFGSVAGTSQELSDAVSRTSLGLSASQLQMLSTSYASDADIASLYGVSSQNTTGISKSPGKGETSGSMRWEVAVFLQQTGISYDELINLLHGDLSPEEIREEKALNFYVNHQDTANRPPMEIRSVADEVTGETTKVIVNTSNIRLSRLNRLIRLSSWTGISTIDLDWTLHVAERYWFPEASESEVMGKAIPVIGVLDTWVKKFGISMNEAVALMGPMRDYGKANGPDFLESIYTGLEYRKDPNWYYKDKLSDTWSIIKKGLNLNDKDLEAIAQTMAQIQGIDDKEKPVILLDAQSLAGLYRVAAWAQKLTILVSQLLLILDENTGNTDRAKTLFLPDFAESESLKNLLSLCNESLIVLSGWMISFNLSYTQTRFMILGTTSATLSGIRGVPADLHDQGVTASEANGFKSDLQNNLNGTWVTDQTFSNLSSFGSLSQPIAYIIPSNFVNTANGIATSENIPLATLINPSMTASDVKTDMARVGYHETLTNQNEDGIVLDLPDLKLSKVQDYVNVLLKQGTLSLQEQLATLKAAIFIQALKKRLIGYLNQLSYPDSSFVRELSALFYRNGEKKEKGVVTLAQILEKVPLREVNQGITTSSGIQVVPAVTAELLHTDLMLSGNLIHESQINPGAINWVDSALSNFQFYVTKELNLAQMGEVSDMIDQLASSLLSDDESSEYTRLLAYLQSVDQVSQVIESLKENRSEEIKSENITDHSIDSIVSFFQNDKKVMLSQDQTAQLFVVAELILNGYFPHQISQSYNYLQTKQQEAFNSTMASFLEVTASDVENNLYDWSNVIGWANGYLTVDEPTPNIYFTHANSQTTQYSNYLTYLKQLNLTINSFGLNGATTSYALRTKWDVAQLYHFSGLFDVSFLQYLTNKYKDGKGKIVQSLNDNSLHALAEATGWSQHDMESVNSFWKGYDPALDENLSVDLVRQYDVYFSLTDYTGLATESVQAIAKRFESVNSSDFDQVNRLLQAALQAKYHTEGEWQTLYQPVQLAIDELRRDLYVGLFIYGCSLDSDLMNINSPNAVTEYLCIDVAASGVLTDSWIEAAMESLQFYLNRCAQNIETEVDLRPDFNRAWGYINTLSHWQQGRLVFLYPENFLDPASIDNPSKAYTDFQNDLTANNIDKQTIDQAFKDYLTDFQEIADLDVISFYKGKYAFKEGQPVVSLVMLAKTKNSPTSFYYRKANFIINTDFSFDTEQSEEENLRNLEAHIEVEGFSITENWEFPWVSISSNINASSAGIIEAFGGRVFVFWTEYTSDSSVNKENFGYGYYTESGTNQSGDTPFIQGKVNYTYYQPNENTWSAPQQLGDPLTFLNPEGSLTDAQNSEALSHVTLQSHLNYIAYETPAGAGILTEKLKVYPSIVDFQGPDFCNSAIIPTTASDSDSFDYASKINGISMEGIMRGTQSYVFSDQTSSNAYCIAKPYTTFTDSYSLSFIMRISNEYSQDYPLRGILNTQNKATADDTTSLPGDGNAYVGPALVIKSSSTSNFVLAFSSLQISSTQDSSTIAISGNLSTNEWYQVSIRVNANFESPLVFCEIRDINSNVVSLSELSVPTEYCGLFSSTNVNKNGPLLALGSTMPKNWFASTSEAEATASELSSTSSANIRSFPGKIQSVYVFKGLLPFELLQSLKPMHYTGTKEVGNAMLTLSGMDQVEAIKKKGQTTCHNFDLSSVGKGGMTNKVSEQLPMVGQIVYKGDENGGVQSSKYAVNGYIGFSGLPSGGGNILLLNLEADSDGDAYTISYQLNYILKNNQIVLELSGTLTDGANVLDLTGWDSDKFQPEMKTGAWYYFAFNSVLDPENARSIVKLEVLNPEGEQLIGFSRKVDLKAAEALACQKCALQSGSLFFQNSEDGAHLNYFNFSIYAGGNVDRYFCDNPLLLVEMSNLMGRLPQDAKYLKAATDYAEIYKGAQTWNILKGEEDQVLVYESSRKKVQNFVNTYNTSLLHQYSITRISSPVVTKLMSAFLKAGAKGLMSDIQQSQVESMFQVWMPSDYMVLQQPKDQIDFMSGANRQYFWELWFWCPWLIANTYSSESMYADSIMWMKYIFDPTVRLTARSGGNGRVALKHPNDIYWRFLGLRAENNPYLSSELDRNATEEEMAELSFGKSASLSADAEELARANWIYHNNPYDANAIAGTRPIAYQKSIVLAYTETEINWGDQNYTINTRESIGVAELLYREALDLLGPQPADVGQCPMSPVKTVGQLITYPIPDPFDDMQNPQIDPAPIPEFVAWLEAYLINKGLSNKFGIQLNSPNNYILGSYFQMDENQRLINDYNTINQRLSNINAMLTIDGEPDYLPLFTANPIVLAEYSGQVSDTTSNMASLTGLNVPYFKFERMVEFARGFVELTNNLGDRLQQALMGNDQQYLSDLITSQEEAVFQLSIAFNNYEIEAAQCDLDALQSALTRAQDTFEHYNNLIQNAYLPAEDASFSMESLSQAFMSSGTMGGYAASAIADAPNIFGASTGGGQWYQTFAQYAQANTNTGFQLNMLAGVSQYNAGYQRMKQNWEIEKTVASDDISAINNQISAAQYRLMAAQQQLTITQTQYQQQKAIYTYKKNMFTNQAFYQWQISQLSPLYRQSYQLAYNMCLCAEKSYQFERGYADSYIQNSTWDNSKLGLLAGQNLAVQLEQLANAFIQKDNRRMEIVKTISLKELGEGPIGSSNYGVLQDLINTGSCQFDWSEYLFDLDYPGDTLRQIASISITIPAVVGPYKNIHAKLTQLSNKVLLSEDKGAVQSLLGISKNGNGSIGQIRSDWFPNQQVNISTGINDAGMFQLGFGDGRLLPFQYTGAISSWHLEIPKAQNTILLQPKDGVEPTNGEPISLDDCILSMSDVIIELRYYAQSASTSFAQYVSGLVQPNQYYWQDNQVVNPCVTKVDGVNRMDDNCLNTNGAMPSANGNGTLFKKESNSNGKPKKEEVLLKK